MEGIDPEVLLEWLQTGIGDERDLQLMALEQLCMLLLMSDNIDRCFESCPPRTFIPALCRIFLDETATDNVLEVTARAITYYLDVSNECTRRITQVDGAVKAICDRLASAQMADRTSKDLAEQCVKLLEHVCQRETMAVYEAGGVHAMLNLVRQHGQHVHKDTMHSAMSVVTRLCGKMEPSDPALTKCSESLGALLVHDDAKVSESALRCFAALTDRFIRKMLDPAELTAHSNLVDHLLSTLCNEAADYSANFISIVLSLLSNLCRGSAAVTEQVLSSPKLMSAVSCVLSNKDDRVVTDGLRLADLLVMLLCEGRAALPYPMAVQSASDSLQVGANTERAHRQIIDSIRQKDLNSLIDAIEGNVVDVNFTDDVGQTLCNWASAFGSIEMVQYLCDKGADVNKGHKSSSLHYAACFGRPDIVKLLLQRGANPDLRDEDGKTALDKARERSDEEHVQVATILESPSVYMHAKKEDKKQPASASSSSSGGEAETSSVLRSGTEANISDLPDRHITKRVLQQLLPIFCEIFQKSLSANVRRTSLNLLRKIVDNVDQTDLKPLCEGEREKKDDTGASAGAGHGAENLVNVVVAVLDQEDDLEGQEQVLMILSSLLKKDSSLWVNELIRLGVFERVEAIAKPPQELFDEKEAASATSSSVHQSSGNRELTPIGEEQHSHTTASSRTSAMSISRSTASTPSVAFDSERETLSNIDESDRMAMLNTMLSLDSELVQGTSMETPPPTVEVDEVAEIPVAVMEKRHSKMTIAEAGGQDKTELHKATAYRWKEWRIARGDVSLFVWNDVVVVELNLQSNGWFQFLMDGELWMVWNGGIEERKEGPVRLADGRAMVARWREAKAACGEDAVPINVLTSSKKMEAGSWQVWCTKANEILLKTTGGHAAKTTVSLKDDTGAVAWEIGKDKERKALHTPAQPLPAEFHTGWAMHGTSTKRRKLTQEIQRRRVQALAWELWTGHLKEARAKPREVVLKLQNAAGIIHDAVMRAIQLSSISRPKQIKQPRIEQVRELVGALQLLHEVVVGDCRLSTFEFSTSGIVSALHELLALAEIHPESYPARMFREAFSSPAGLSSLLQKLISVLESTEKFPQYLYDIPGGSSYGLQLLSRRLRIKLEMAPNQAAAEASTQQQLLDKTGKLLKSEPLATVGQIKSAVLKMVARQWYERERSSFAFVKAIQGAMLNPAQNPLKFVYTSDFDDQGIMYWLGTNGRTREWTNPAAVGVVKVSCSDIRQPFGKPEDIISRDVNPLNCHTSDDKNANFTIDLGVYIYPTSYTLRHARGYGRSALRNWLFQGSKDKQVWEMLVAHLDDSSLGDPGSTATWPIEDNHTKGPYRYFRIAQNGKNSSNQTYYLSLSGFEIYGEIVDVVVDGFVTPKEELKEDEKKSSKAATKSTPFPKMNNRQALVLQQGQTTSGAGAQQSQTTQESKSKLRMPGTLLCSGREIRGWRVVRGPDWRWDDQDSEGHGRVVGSAQAGWVEVLWDNGYKNSYRYGAEGKYDVKRIDPPSGSAPPTASATKTGTEAGKSSGSPITNSMLKAFARGRTFGGKAVDRPSDDAFTFSNFLKSKAPAASTASTPLSRFTKPSASMSTASSGNASAGPSSVAQAGSTTSAQASQSTIGKKSMSTTNLVDERHSTGPSVASTGQAASAESLQHQTPSLENLLAKANTHAFGRIAETQESGETEGGRETPIVLREARDENEEEEEEITEGEAETDADGSTSSAGTTLSSNSSATSDSRSQGSSNVDMSICSSRSSVIDATPRETPATPATLSGEKTNNSLSVSAPDLAARQRQQSSEASSELDQTLEDPEEGSMDEDEEENESPAATSLPSVTLPLSGRRKKHENWSELFDDVMGIQSAGWPRADLRRAPAAERAESSDRSFLEKVRDVLAGEDSHDPAIAGLFSGTESSRGGLATSQAARISAPQPTPPSGGSSANTTMIGRPDKPELTPIHPPPSSTSLKQTIGKYADVLKGIMQSLQVMDTQSTAMEMEELMDEDEYYEDEDGNEDDVDEDLAMQLGIPVETFASVLRHGARDLKLNWKQLSQYMLSGGPAWDTRSGEGRELRNYDDEVIIKCVFQSLIPAFDPRPGRANVNQIQEVELPAAVGEPVTAVKSCDDPSIRLYLRGPNLSGVDNVTVAMLDDDASFFKYVQKLANLTNWSSKSERSRRIWEPTYTLLYEDSSEETAVQVDTIEEEASKVPHGVNECLETIGLLSRMQDVSINPQVFISDKLTMKLTQELSDALVVAARALPDWCARLVYTYPCLFSVETRNMYLQATEFGVTRTIVWLQSRRDAALDRARGTGQTGTGSASRPDRYQEYRVGRLKTERIKVSRAEDHLLEQAIRVMKFHAERKSVLEIDFTNEEGTGLGPTLEFYALVAAELQKKSLAIWLCDDADEHTLKHEERELDLGEGKKPPGYYVRRTGGLFPAPLPPHTEELHKATEIFRILGIFLAKVLQDGRLVDLPLSRPFLKMLTSLRLTENSEPTLERVLSLDDLEEVHPVKGNFLKELRALAQRKRVIESEPLLDRESKRRKVDELKLCIHGTRCRVEDLALNFTVNPSSKVYGYEEMELVEGGADMDVTMDNVELYVQKVADFYLQSGIMSQMRAFREGFDRVFPLKALRSYSPEEVQRLLSGEQCPEWTREDVLNFTEPKLGYSRDSPGFLRFVDVMVGLNAQERKNFLQFATGCSSLPPGGLANLHPRLTVVRKVESGDGSYPSVNTCVHYLKLPEYSSVEILRDRLLTAINEKGFHLN